MAIEAATLSVSIKGDIDQLVGSIKTAEQRLNSFSAQVGQNVTRNITEIDRKSVKAATDMQKQFQSSVGNINKDLGRLASTSEQHFGKIEKEASKATAKAKDSFGGLIGTITSALGGLTGTIASGAFSIISSGINGAIAKGQEFDDTLERLKTRMRALGGDASGTNELIENLKKISADRGLEFAPLAEASIRFKTAKISIKETTDYIKSATAATVAFAGGQPMLQKIVDSFAALASKEGSVGDHLKELQKIGLPVFETLSQASGLTVKQLKKLADAGALNGRVAAQLLSNRFSSQFGSQADQVVTGTLFGSSSRMDALQAQLGGKAMEKPLEEQAKAINQVNRALSSGTANQIVEGISKTAEKVFAATNKALELLASGNYEEFGKFVTEQIVSGLKESFKFIIDEVKALGPMIVKGLKDGLTGSAKGVFDALREMAGDAVDVSKDALESHSPSRKFFEIGKDITSGLILGIQAGTAEAVAATTGMINSVTGSGQKQGQGFQQGKGSLQSNTDAGAAATNDKPAIQQYTDEQIIAFMKSVIPEKLSAKGLFKRGVRFGPGFFTSGRGDWDNAIKSNAAKMHLDPAQLFSQILFESAFRTNAASNKDAHGLMQLIPGTAARYKLKDSSDAIDSIRAGSEYDKFLMDTFGGNRALALAGYNAGEGKAVRAARGFPETRAYIRNILGATALIEQDPSIAQLANDSNIPDYQPPLRRRSNKGRARRPRLQTTQPLLHDITVIDPGLNQIDVPAPPFPLTDLAGDINTTLAPTRDLKSLSSSTEKITEDFKELGQTGNKSFTAVTGSVENLGSLLQKSEKDIERLKLTWADFADDFEKNLAGALSKGKNPFKDFFNGIFNDTRQQFARIAAAHIRDALFGSHSQNQAGVKGGLFGHLLDRNQSADTTAPSGNDSSAGTNSGGSAPATKGETGAGGSVPVSVSTALSATKNPIVSGLLQKLPGIGKLFGAKAAAKVASTAASSGTTAATSGGFLSKIGMAGAFSNPVSAIATLAPIAIPLISHLFGSGDGLKELKAAIQSRFKVTVKDNKVLNQIKQIEEQTFGPGTLKAHVQDILVNQQVKDIIEGYSESTLQLNNTLVDTKHKTDIASAENQFTRNVAAVATGGPVIAGLPYLVGERRAELFVPGTSGRILPDAAAYLSSQRQKLAKFGGSSTSQDRQSTANGQLFHSSIGVMGERIDNLTRLLDKLTAISPGHVLAQGAQQNPTAISGGLIDGLRNNFGHRRELNFLTGA